MRDRQRRIVFGTSLYAAFWILLAIVIWVRRDSLPNPLILMVLIPLVAAAWEYTRAGR